MFGDNFSFIQLSIADLGSLSFSALFVKFFDRKAIELLSKFDTQFFFYPKFDV
jgi:hypothetical protein